MATDKLAGFCGQPEALFVLGVPHDMTRHIYNCTASVHTHSCTLAGGVDSNVVSWLGFFATELSCERLLVRQSI